MRSNKGIDTKAGTDRDHLPTAGRGAKARSYFSVGSEALLALLVVGCGGGDETCIVDSSGELACTRATPTEAADVDEAPLQERLQSLHADLDVGSEGPEVRAVHDYLNRYGYFPNDELARQHRSWIPMIDEVPADWSLYGPETAEAISSFQGMVGLEQTGVADAPTRAALQSPRCGHPDGRRPDGRLTEKFAYIDGVLHGTQWTPGQVVTWRLTNTNDVTLSDARGAANNAFTTWIQETYLAHGRLESETSDIQITFADIDGAGGTIAQAAGPGDGGDITVDSSELWSVQPAGFMPAGSLDLQTTLTHEIGHALGLAHSSRPQARMRPGQQADASGPIPNFQQRNLFVDDIVAAAAMYDQWEQMNTLTKARDIAVARTGSVDGAAWVITDTPVGSNYTIAQWVAGTHFDTSNGAAVRIAVAPNGRPWVLDSAGGIWRRTTFNATSGTWQQIPGCAKDIGIGGATGGEGVIWVLGCTAVGGNYSIFRYKHPTPPATVGVFEQANNGAGVRIAVDSGGVPWVVSSSGLVWYRSTGGTPPVPVNSITAPHTWTQTNGSGIANDIGVAESNYPWIIGQDPDVGGFGIWLWNNQASGGGTPPAPAKEEWLRITNGAIAISVGPNARPWVAASDGTIWRLRP